MEPINELRREWAKIAVVAHQKAMKQSPSMGMDYFTNVVDLVTDCIHLANSLDSDGANKCLRSARMHYEAEINGEE